MGTTNAEQAFASWSSGVQQELNLALKSARNLLEGLENHEVRLRVQGAAVQEIEKGLEAQRQALDQMLRRLSDLEERARGLVGGGPMPEERATTLDLKQFLHRSQPTGAGEGRTGSGTTPTCGSTGGAGEKAEVEITPEMIEAGVKTANLLQYEWGDTDERALVRRVFRAMDAERQRRWRARKEERQ